jgi:hypothetical protein
MAGRSRYLSSGNKFETTTQKDFTSACKLKMAILQSIREEFYLVKQNEMK